MPIQKLFTRKKGRLALAVGLTVIGVSVLHERMGRALEFSLPLESAPAGLHNLSAIPLEKPAASQTPAATPQTSASPSAQSVDKPSEARIAVNAKSSDASSASAPEVQLDTVQLAALSEWQGASFPVEDFQTYTSPFGYRMSPDGGYSQEFHYGLDMAAPEGSYIRNWWSGTVVEVSDDSNCGTSVVIESGPWLHIYCHMSGHVDSDSQGRYMIDRDGGLKIYEGQVVAAGDRIGRVGMTGRTTGPHLHWGLKYDNNWVDPAFVLQAMYYSQRATAQSVQ